MTVAYCPGDKHQKPMIRIANNWLSKAGFLVGNRIQVKYRNDRIIINRLPVQNQHLIIKLNQNYVYISYIKKFWSESEDDWLETEEVLGYEPLDLKGKVIARAETPAEVESILISAYLDESNPKMPQIKLGKGFLRKKVTQNAD